MCTLPTELKIAVHGGEHHCDDVTGAAIAELAFGPVYSRIKFIRTRDPSKLAECQCWIDVGREYDAELLRFDHHQMHPVIKRENGCPLAASGLVWMALGRSVVKNVIQDHHLAFSSHLGRYFDKDSLCLDELFLQRVADRVDENFIQAIDAADNRVDVVVDPTPTFDGMRTLSLSRAIRLLNPIFEDPPKEPATVAILEQRRDVAFDFARLIVGELLRHQVMQEIRRVEAYDYVTAEADRLGDVDVLVLDRGLPWQEAVVGKRGTVYVVLPSDGNQWLVQGVPESHTSQQTIIPFPEEWRGKAGTEFIEASAERGALFCHSNGHLAVARDKQAAIRLANESLKLAALDRVKQLTKGDG